MRAFDRYDVTVLLGCAVYLYANLFADPKTPYLLGGDQVFFWTSAQRMLYGEQIYRDFFQFTPPGTDLAYLSVFKLFGPHIWTTNLVVLLLGVVLGLLCWRVGRSIMPRPEAALGTALYLAFVFGGQLNATHHFFSFLAVLGAVVLLLEGRSPMRVALAGAMLGLATFFTQTRGPAGAFGIAGWLTWEKFRLHEPWLRCLRRQGLLFATLVVTWLALSSHYIATVGLRQLWFFQVTYVREYMVSGWHAQFATPEARPYGALVLLVRWLFGYTLLPTVYLICFWKCWKLHRAMPADSAARIALLTAVGAALWLEVAQSPSWFRFLSVSMPGVILLIWLLPAAGKLTYSLVRLLWIGVIGLAAHQTWQKHLSDTVVQQLPAGRVAEETLDAEKSGWLAAHTKPGEFVLQVEYPKVYLPLGLRNPIFLDVVSIDNPPTLGYLALSIRQLEEKPVKFIVETPVHSVPSFHEYLVDRYRMVWRFSDRDEVWERKPRATAPNNQQF
jgi:hypothetical protein